MGILSKVVSVKNYRTEKPMPEIIPLLMCLEAYLSTTILHQLHHVVFAMLCIPNRVTMLGLSR
jgi:hypothetical protein